MDLGKGLTLSDEEDEKWAIPQESPEDINLDWSEFTVFIHDIPYQQRTLAMAHHIGARFGILKETDCDDSGLSMNPFFKIRVSLNTSKPLRQVMKLVSPIGEEFCVCFTYAGLPNIYFYCGIIGHISKFCSLQYEENFVDPGANTLLVHGYANHRRL
ncbi:hypothetical protein Salat_1202500 [Sesamum alatum]|uniref:Zinc knuckle CX2CX4HX4C domain-containing protein n=1 Tax=Sesamum alatum TaxID=300844 RepID=A0AAE1YEZ4_9LAMI|nr:hypothetical protein Salat_1202500 [Sesamum alatum]